MAKEKELLVDVTIRGDVGSDVTGRIRLTGTGVISEILEVAPELEGEVPGGFLFREANFVTGGFLVKVEEADVIAVFNGGVKEVRIPRGGFLLVREFDGDITGLSFKNPHHENTAVVEICGVKGVV